MPDHTTVMNFRHLLKQHGLAHKLFEEVSTRLSEAGVLVKEETLMDATIIYASSLTKNKAGARDPEMRQTRKGNQWYSGMKAHIGVDAKTGLTHRFTTTAANEHELNQAHHLLHGEVYYVVADAGYRGSENRPALKHKEVDWYIAQRPGTLRGLKKQPRIHQVELSIEYLKASIRAKVENPFRIIKCQFGFSKALYRGLMKNDGKLAMLFALANIAREDQMMRA